MIDNDIHLVIISDSLTESSAPVWIIDNDIHVKSIVQSITQSIDLTKCCYNFLIDNFF